MSVAETERAPLVTPAGRLAFAVTLAAVLVDQLSKFWIVYLFHLPEKFSVPVIPPVLRFTMVWNRGVTFGMFRADNAFGRVALSLLAAVVIAFLADWARKAERRLTAVALGLIMGGAIGNNLIDRVRMGHVADFIDVTGIGFFPWVFNGADVMIDIGIGLLILDLLRPNPTAPAT